MFVLTFGQLNRNNTHRPICLNKTGDVVKMTQNTFALNTKYMCDNLMTRLSQKCMMLFSGM